MLKLEIISPEKQLFNDSITLVQAPGSDGSFEILENHAPIISTLDKGEIRVVKSDLSEERFPVESGVLECQNNEVRILLEK